MRFKPLLLTMLMLAGFSMANAKIVEIGTSANKLSEPELPFVGYSNHSVTQQLYWNSILGRTAQTFNSISFFNTSEAATRTIDIYLTPTVYGTYGGGNEWVPVIESEKVFSGTVTFEKNVWTTITFDTPHDYDPTKSLAITVDDNTGETSSPTPSFLSGFTLNWCALTTYGDEDISVTDLSTINGNLYGFRNQIRLNEGDVIGLPCHSSLPTTNFYNYSFSEQIYTAEEIGGSGVITSLSFLDLTADFSRNIALYLVHTDKTAFDNGIDWINVSASDKVFDGTVNFEKGTWTPIHFDVPFKYDGLKNLAVVVKDKTNSYDKIEQFAVFPTELNQSLYDARDDAEHNLSNLSAYTGISNAIKSQIQFNIEPGLIGDGGTSTDSYLPTYTWYKYSLSQQIYTKEELGGAQDLTSVSFFNAGTQVTRNLNIYLVPTYATEFADGNSWIAFNESNLVFSGKVTFYEDVWTPITFTTPYSYNGKTNLALVVADNTGRYASYGYRNQLNCRSFSANKMSLYCYKDAVESAESITSIFGTVGSSKNQICINRADDVPNGPELLNSYTYPYSIYLKWRDDGSCDTWELQYREADELTWHTEILTSNSYTASDLMSYRDYFIRVRKVFEDGSVSKWMSLVFNTPLPEPYNIAVETTPTSATIDWRGYTDNTFDVMYYNKENFDIIFYDDFDEYTFSQKGWTRLMNGETPPDYSNGWTDGRDRPFSMYYSAISYSWYDYNTYHADNWLISPLVDLKGTLSFWQYVSGNYPDSYEVKLSTSGNDISDFVYTLRPLSPGEPGWNEMRYDLSPYEGEKGYIAIHHKDYDQMLLSIDNFMIFTGEMHYVNTGELSWVTIEGLQPNTEYGYIIYAHKLGDYSANSELDYFTTLPTNPTPYAIVAKPELTSAELSWKGYSDSREG